MTRFMITLVALALFAGSGLAKQANKSDEKKESAAAETVDTPFGPVSKQKAAAKPAPKAKAPSMVKVKIDGDVVSFSRRTPFGAQSWTRSKSELSASEKEWVREAGLSLDAKPAKPAPKP